jgi:hypothetical protein
MWVCPKCGEPHEDHFKICWKCASQEMEEQVTAEAPPRVPKPEPRLRSGSVILLRVGIAFVVGVVLGAAAFPMFLPATLQASLGEIAASAVPCALFAGVALAIPVGIFFWVIFPYEPTAVPEPAEKKDGPGDSA